MYRENTKSSASYSSKNSITGDTNISGKNYTSSTAEENALPVSKSTVTLDDATVTKTGDSTSGDNSNFYGTNSAIIAKDGANPTIKNSSITTNADGTNGVFTYVGTTTNNSNFEGAINNDNTAKEISLKLDKTSKIKLTNDTYVTALVDDDETYGNIDFNGYKLYVNNKAIN